MSIRVTLSVASLICNDMEALASFYAATFDLPELEHWRSDTFMGLDLDGVILGFSPRSVYDLLGIQRWAIERGTREVLTFEVGTDREVDERSGKAVQLGGELVHEPYSTPYGAYQTVLADPEGHVFRINHFR